MHYQQWFRFVAAFVSIPSCEINCTSCSSFLLIIPRCYSSRAVAAFSRHSASALSRTLLRSISGVSKFHILLLASIASSAFLVNLTFVNFTKLVQIEDRFESRVRNFQLGFHLALSSLFAVLTSINTPSWLRSICRQFEFVRIFHAGSNCIRIIENLIGDTNLVDFLRIFCLLASFSPDWSAATSEYYTASLRLQKLHNRFGFS